MGFEVGEVDEETERRLRVDMLQMDIEYVLRSIILLSSLFQKYRCRYRLTWLILCIEMLERRDGQRFEGRHVVFKRCLTLPTFCHPLVFQPSFKAILITFTTQCSSVPTALTVSQLVTAKIVQTSAGASIAAAEAASALYAAWLRCLDFVLKATLQGLSHLPIPIHNRTSSTSCSSNSGGIKELFG